MEIKNRDLVTLTVEERLESALRWIAHLEEQNKKLVRQAERLEEENGLDYLLGVNNRRGGERTAERLVKEIFREERRREEERHELVILFLDIDDFKKINDTYTEFYGDQVLRQAVAYLKREARRRESDIISRWGGEEFVIFYPRSTAAVVQGLFLRSVEEGAQLGFEAVLHIESPKDRKTEKVFVPVTFSGGLTDYNPFVDFSWRDALQRANAAMKAAKRAGKNRILKYPACRIQQFFPDLPEGPA